MEIQPFKHVIWDWNGTLLNDTFLCVEIINEILDSEKIPRVDLPQYRKTFTFPVRLYYERIGLVDQPGRTFENLSALYIQKYCRRWNECRLHPGADQCLEMIHQAGVSQSVLSASEQQILEEAIHHYQILSYFLGLVGQQDYFARGKLEAGRSWIESLDCPPAEILLIGDTLHDYEVAKALGLQCLLVSFGHQSEAILEASGRPPITSMDALRLMLSNYFSGTSVHR